MSALQVIYWAIAILIATFCVCFTIVIIKQTVHTIRKKDSK